LLGEELALINTISNLKFRTSMRFKQFIFLCIMLIMYSATSFAQSKYTISGYVRDATNGEELIGATVYISELQDGTISNEYGFYSITLPKGNYQVEFHYMGYVSVKQRVTLNQNQSIIKELSPNALDLEEIIISGERDDKNVKSTEMGTMKLDPAEVRMIPVLFGEQDILKTIQLMPGIKSAGEGSSGFHVRGGGADQNLILLDEAPVYNASHLLGFFSVFNSDALKDVKIIKGGMPAEYGGRLSSVLDIKMKDGNSKGYDFSGGIGLISSRLTVEGPIVKDKSSFIVSGRRTYADVFLKLSSREELKNTQLYFYDLNVKANYKISDKDRIFVSGYLGRDKFGFNDVMGVDWGNITGTLRWNHIFSDKLFSNTSLIYSDYNYEINASFGDDKISILSGIQDFNFKEDLQYYLNSKNTIKFGLNAIYHTFIPGKVEVSSLDTLFKIEDDFALETAAYVSWESEITSRLKINAGIRFSDFAALGPGDVFTYNEESIVTDTTNFRKNEIIENYWGFEPRFSASFLLNEKSSIKASYNRNRQYLQLVSNATSGTPMDAWIPSSNIVKPGISNQVALGYFRNFNDNSFETSVEIYYKELQNQVDYKNGADLMFNPLIESQLVFGDGRAYGLELYIKKRSGKLTGWISYTLARTENQFDEISNGSWYPVKHDRTHDIAIVGMYQFNEKWNVSATWVYNTGDAVTFPSGKYMIDGRLVSYYTERNGYRMPDYHRLDIGVTYYRKKTATCESSWNASLYNAYGRENAYTINFRQSEDDPNVTEAVQMSLFRFIPSISYNFKF
jgi:hypothetical protein